jgi:hypothetical protein
MDKRQMLIDIVTSGVVGMIIEDTDASEEEAMRQFYNSECFTKLDDVETGLYRESPAYVYDLYLTELEYGHLVQLEV